MMEIHGGQASFTDPRRRPPAGLMPLTPTSSTSAPMTEPPPPSTAPPPGLTPFRPHGGQAGLPAMGPGKMGIGDPLMQKWMALQRQRAGGM